MKLFDQQEENGRSESASRTIRRAGIGLAIVRVQRNVAVSFCSLVGQKLLKRSILAGSVVFALLAFCPIVVDACPTCKDTLGLHALRVQAGYALSIGFMMLVPFAILSAWGITIFRMARAQTVPLPVAKPSTGNSVEDKTTVVAGSATESEDA